MFANIQQIINLLENYKGSAWAERFAAYDPFEHSRRLSYLNNIILQLKKFLDSPESREIDLIIEDINDTMEQRFYPEETQLSDNFPQLLRNVSIQLVASRSIMSKAF